MSEPTLVKLSEIKPNPYQPRTAEDTAAIAEIAVNIFRNGLMQIPSARRVNGHYELVFGHTRKAAYDLLATQGVPSADIAPDKRYSQMPLYIHDLDDRQMFEMAVAENIKRRDLNPIEQATAMQRYMNEFDANSKQAAELFGMSDATVRGVVRLLDLPKQVQDKVASGEISQSAARGLLTLQRISPKSVEKAAKDIADGDNPDTAIDYALMDAKGVKQIYSMDFDPSTNTFNHLPELTLNDIPKVLGIENKGNDRRLFNCIKQANDVYGLIAIWKTSDFETDPALAEKVEHLIKPPACTACPFYARVDGSSYCGIPACADRKTESNISDRLEADSKKLGIAIYQESDGDTFLLDRWNDAHRKQVTKRHADLRLMIVSERSNNGYWSRELGIHNRIGVFAVGKLCEKYKQAKAQEAAESGRTTKDSTPAQRIQAITQEVNRDVVIETYDALMFDVFAHHLEPALTGVKDATLLGVLAERLDVDNERAQELQKEKRSAAAELKYRRQCVMVDLLQGKMMWQARTDAQDAKAPAASLAKHVRKIAAAWGVTLGKDFDLAVTEADKRIQETRKARITEMLEEHGLTVSAATGKGKKK